MKEYQKPEMNVKTLIQDTEIAEEVVYDREVEMSANDWWLDYAE